MKTEKPGRWVHEDAPARRLLEEIGAPDLEYYSAGEERQVSEALKSWPLLAAVSRALAVKEAPPRENEAPLRVVAATDSDATPPREAK